MIKSRIGILAGDIWFLLDGRGKLTLRQLGELTNETEVNLLLALGWLSRENKTMMNFVNKNLEIELIRTIPETFY